MRKIVHGTLLAGLILVPLGVGFYVFYQPVGAGPGVVAPRAVAPVGSGPVAEEVVPVAPVVPVKPAGPTVEEIARMLAGGDGQEKEKGAELLAKFPYQKKEAVRREMEATADAEVKGLLRARLEAIELQLATDPPPVSLHVKDASLYDVVEALNEEMGTAMVASNPGGLYTLDATDMPFWEVMGALNDQAPFWIIGAHKNTFTLTGNRMPGIRYRSIQGPFMLAAYVSVNTTQGTRALQYCLAADPRMRALQAVPEWGEGFDDAGNAMIKPLIVGDGLQARVFKRPEFFVANNLDQMSRGMESPEHVGTMIPSLVVKTHMIYSLGDLEGDIAELGPNSKVQIGEVTAGVSNFEVQERGVQIQFSTQGPNRTLPLTTYLVMDKDNQIKWAQTAQSGAVGMGGQPNPPYRMHILVPRETGERDVTFEIKDLPIGGTAARPRAPAVPAVGNGNLP